MTEKCDLSTPVEPVALAGEKFFVSDMPLKHAKPFLNIIAKQNRLILCRRLEYDRARQILLDCWKN